MPDRPRPKLIILNQMAGLMTWELAEDLGKELGSVALLTGYPDTLAKGSTESVQLYPAAPYRRGSFTRRALSWVRYTVQAFFWLWRWPGEVPLLLFSNPPILCWLGWLMKRLRRQRYAVMVYDIYPNVLANLGRLSQHHLLIRLWYRLNRLAYESAKAVMTLGEYMAANLKKQFDPAKTGANQIEVIYPWVDTDNIRPIPKEENWFAQRHAQVDKITVMYSGNMGLGHDIETMVEAARQLQDVPGLHFMFIGAGPKWTLIEETIGQEGLSNVTLLPWQPEEVLPYSLATADIAVVSLEKELQGLAVPSKGVYAMASGSALLALCSGDSDLASWIRTNDCGEVVEPGNVDDMLRVIVRFLRDGEYLHTCRQRARLVAERMYSRELKVRQIIRII